MEQILQNFKDYLISEGKSHEAIRHYIFHVKAFLQTVSDPSCLTSDMLANYLANRECSQSSRNQRIGSLRKFFDWQGRTDFSFPRQKHISTKAMLLITENQLSDIYQTITYGFRDALMVNALVFLMYHTGLRVKEIVELRCEYFQMEGEVLVLNFPYQGTNRKFCLHDDVKILMTRGDFYSVNIFNTNVGKVKRLFAKLNGYITMKDDRSISPRLLRDSFACNALHKGMSLEELQKLMLHRSIKTTRKYLKLMSQWINKIPEEGMAADTAKDKINSDNTEV